MSRFEAEMEGLARVAANPNISVPARAAAVLVAHSRRDAGSCICGWAKLGSSFARHQADVLDEAGLLAPSRNAPDARRIN